MTTSSTGPPDPPDDEPESGPRVRREIEKLAAKYMERAPAWAIRAGAPSTEAEDLTQDALEALWRHRFEVKSEVWPKWLHTAVRLRQRQARRAFRISEKHVPKISYESELDAGEAAPRTPEDELAREQTRAAVRGLIEQLAPERRAVVELYLFEERSMEEVAAELGISEEGAWSRWRRARRELRAMVERRRERERFAGGGISFGVALALWRWVERRARSAARWRESLGGALVVASVAAFIAGDAWVRPAPGSTLAATIRMPVAIAASETEPAGAPRASIGTLVFDSTAPAQSTVTPARSTAAPAQSTAARGEPSSSASPAQVVPVGRGQAPEVSASTDPPAAAVSSRRQAARAHMVRARAALHQEKNIAKARALIEMYEAAFPEDPFPDQHAALRAALNEP